MQRAEESAAPWEAIPGKKPGYRWQVSEPLSLSLASWEPLPGESCWPLGSVLSVVWELSGMSCAGRPCPRDGHVCLLASELAISRLPLVFVLLDLSFLHLPTPSHWQEQSTPRSLLPPTAAVLQPKKLRRSGGRPPAKAQVGAAGGGGDTGREQSCSGLSGPARALPPPPVPPCPSPLGAQLSLLEA